METIQIRRQGFGRHQINFHWAPEGDPFTATFDGNTVPWDADEPSAGAPAQDEVPTAEASTGLTFTADVTPAPGTAIVSYVWHFGDGARGYGAEVDHTYEYPIKATRVALVIGDSIGRTFSITKNINLH